jgi:hypothetical protein
VQVVVQVTRVLVAVHVRLGVCVLVAVRVPGFASKGSFLGREIIVLLARTSSTPIEPRNLVSTCPRVAVILSCCTRVAVVTTPNVLVKGNPVAVRRRRHSCGSCPQLGNPFEAFFGSRLPIRHTQRRPSLTHRRRLKITHPLGTHRPRHHRPSHVVAGRGRRGGHRTDFQRRTCFGDNYGLGLRPRRQTKHTAAK